ncbi:hypothetical protein RHGRI_019397 [Rhododendron griersonianum]|uniref:SWIM-type domain-containing protein n=1 Tax=Rhododendron griersonianum TaxID=479676 RepID=A0AAV6JFU3_9ERIC|nr:hypothetical protein RHGRI_019397 [Rhododendron griersonianum]
METKSSYTNDVALERIFCTLKEVLVFETVVLAEKCICWLLLVIGSLPYDLLPEVNHYDRRFALVDRAREPDVQNDDDSKGEGHDVQEKRDSDDHNVDYMSIGGGRSDDDDATNAERGSNDGDEDGDDGYSENDYDEEDDGQEYEDDEDEDEDGDDDDEEEEEIEMEKSLCHLPRSSPHLPRTQKENPRLATLLSPSVPSSPPYIHPVDVAAAPTTNSNGVGLPSDDPDSNPDPKPTFDENKAKILRLKLPPPTPTPTPTSNPTFLFGSVDTTDSEYDDDTDNEPGYGSLLRHAREIYASPSFHMFENEYKKSKTLDVDVSTEDDDRRGLVIEYKIQKMGHKFREYTVTAMPLEGIINCSCKLFDLVGILCCHAIKVLGCLRIEKIPDHHLMKWQTKNGNRLMGAGSVKKSGSKDDLDMLTKRICTPLLRHAGVIYLGNFFCISQETFKRSEYLSVETVRETFGDRKLIYDGEARKCSNSRYHVDAPLLRHTRDIYTSNVFSVFHEEYKKSELLCVRFIHETFSDMGLHFVCEVRKPRHSRSHRVHAEANRGTVYCSCNGFGNTGILCCHALAVLDCLFIERIPPRYILKEFMKKPGIGLVEKDIHGEKYPELELETKRGQSVFISITVSYILGRNFIEIVFGCSTAMETKSSYTNAVALERIFCTMKEVLVVVNVVVAEKCLYWLLLVIGSLPYDLLLEVKHNDERFPIVNRVREPDVQNDDAGKNEGNDVHEKCDSDDHDVDYMSIGGGSDDGDGDPDDDNDDGDGTNDERGSSDGDEDGDDGNSEDHYDEEDDGEEYEDDEEEEEGEIEMSVDTTESEYNDDTDDEPGYGSLLRHAREVYASTSFFIFENEYKKSKTLDVDVSNEDHDERGLVFEYKLQKTGHKFREHTVTALPLDGIINCSCKYFDLVGILCCHAITVLGCLRIEKIPDPHILKWQTKKGNQLMGAGSVKKSGSKDELDMCTKRVSIPPLRHAGDVYLANIFPMSQETFKRSEYLSVETVRDTISDGELIYDGEARKHKQSRYHVDAPLLRFTRDIYTSNVFSVFREEYKKSEHLFVMFIRQTFDDMGLCFVCDVRKPRHSRSHIVLAEANKGLVKCSCKGFENTGILCCHALAVLDCLFIERVPPRYLLEEFMKNPGIGPVEKDIHGEKYPELERFVRWLTLRYGV